jgi:hypothetical protein
VKNALVLAVLVAALLMVPACTSGEQDKGGGKDLIAGSSKQKPLTLR